MSFKTEEECSAWFTAVNEHIEYFLDDKSRENRKKSQIATNTVSADDISDEMLEAKFESFFGSFDERSIERTWLTSQVLIFPLKLDFPENKELISVISDVSHSLIGP